MWEHIGSASAGPCGAGPPTISSTTVTKVRGRNRLRIDVGALREDFGSPFGHQNASLNASQFISTHLHPSQPISTHLRGVRGGSGVRGVSGVRGGRGASTHHITSHVGVVVGDVGALREDFGSPFGHQNASLNSSQLISTHLNPSQPI